MLAPGRSPCSPPPRRPGPLTCAAEKEEDLKLLESGLPGGGGAPVLVPKAIDADDSDEADSSEEDSDGEVRLPST